MLWAMLIYLIIRITKGMHKKAAKPVISNALPKINPTILPKQTKRPLKTYNPLSKPPFSGNLKI